MLNFKVLTIAVAAAVTMLTVSPARANSASSADIAAPLREAEAARGHLEPNSSDDQFQRLFASWQSLDGNVRKAVIVPRTGAVSIPSIVPLASTTVISGFGMRWHPVLGGRRAHKGVDLPAATGTPIHASADGVVAMAERFGGYGLFVELEHGGNLETRYGHMSRIAVASGQRVKKGDVIGYVGSTGRSTGPHLHYEVRVNGDAVNPVPYMQGGTQDSRLASR